ncbi:unnamed protein product [Anisakis simplex]|uniref:Methyltransferase n=1 Tax=Anisakis simplex TaxID=6269 RepID=A0A0M3J9F5_ANISI|nr:unnamed protein product [Anisakis simplex]
MLDGRKDGGMDGWLDGWIQEGDRWWTAAAVEEEEVRAIFADYWSRFGLIAAVRRRHALRLGPGLAWLADLTNCLPGSQRLVSILGSGLFPSCIAGRC